MLNVKSMAPVPSPYVIEGEKFKFSCTTGIRRMLGEFRFVY